MICEYDVTIDIASDKTAAASVGYRNATGVVSTGVDLSHANACIFFGWRED